MSQEFQRDYLIRLPLPLAQLYQRAYNDKSAQSRHNNTFYLFEALIKLAASPIIAAYLYEVEQGGARVAELDRLLVQLALPSLGQWVGMLRTLAKHFGTRPDAAAHPLSHLWDQLNRPYRDRPGLLALFRRIKNGLEGEPAGDQSCTPLQLIDALVPYRNAVFGHGGGRFESFYECEMGPLLFPAANEMLAEGMLDILGPRGSRLVHIAEVRMLDEDRIEVGLRELVGERSARTAPVTLSRAQAADLVPDRVAVLWPGRPVPRRLDPLLLYREREMGDEVLFLNRDRNGRQVEYLSYTRGEPERDRATAPAMAALLARVTGRDVAAEQLDALAQQSMAETPTVEMLFGPPPLPARTLGDYEILTEIGRGGMGVVYLARQLSLGRLVALKMLPADLAGDEVALARFRREMGLLARCDHPHIIKVLASGTLPDGRLYYAMEYVNGSDLEQVWRELSGGDAPGDNSSTLGSSTWARAVLSATRKSRPQTARRPAACESPSEPESLDVPSLPLPPVPELPSAPDDPGGYARRVAALVRDAARALQAVHEQMVVHRDVKPGNLMLSPDGTRVVLMDFGLAKGQDLELSASRAGGGLLGTLRYAAPEQLAAASLRVGPEADIRGLGVTLWELLTRRRLFADAADERQLAMMVHEQDVPRLRTIDSGFDRDLEAIVARATERRVSDRIATAAQLADYLQLYLDGKPLPIRPPTIAELAGRWARRHRAGLTTGAALLVFATVVVVALRVTDQARLNRLQRTAEAAVEQCNTALLQDDPKGAQQSIASALGTIGSEPRLAGLRNRAQRLLDEANRRLEDEIARQRDQARYDTFMEHYDDALLHGTLFTGRDTGGQRAQAAARQALAVFGCKEDRSGQSALALDLARVRLGDREKERVRAGCYELERLLGMLDPTKGAPPPAAAPSGGALSDAVGHFLAGLARYYAEDPRQAGREFEAALQAYPEHYWAQYFLALCHLKRRQWSEARMGFNGCLGRKPLSLWPLALRGYVAGEMRDFEAAEADFARALALAPDDYGILVNRGAMRRRRGKLAEATEDLHRAMAREPEHYLAYANLARVYAAQLRWDEAIAQIDEAIRRSPSLAFLHRTRARIHVDAGKPTEAQRDYAQALRLTPAGSAFAHLWSAEQALVQRRYRDALQSFDSYERLEVPDAQFYQDRGLARAMLHDYAGAVEDYTRALALEPNSDVSARRGWAYALQGAALALHEFEQSLAQNAGNLDAHAGRGYALARLGRHREAAREAERALGPGVQDWQTKYNVACIYAQAVIPARNDPDQPDGAALADQYRDQALRLIRAALELAGDPAKRPALWRAIAADPALDPIRTSAGFAELDTAFSRVP
jgi:serine/threonine protein kinase/Tfp pilus assembly protein PilF